MTHRIVFLDRATIIEHIPMRAPNFTHNWCDYPLTAPGEVLKNAANADIVITNKVVFSAETIRQLPRLKHIAVIATGYNNIDIDACRSHNISVSNTRGYANVSVPEHTIALLLTLRRHILTYQNSVQNGEWQKSPFFHHYIAPTYDLAQSQIGIIGSGDLGKGTARLAAALGMKVVYADRKGQAPSGREHYQPFEQVIADSDVISLHCPLTPTTYGLIGAEEMRTMKSTALLINTARGGLINEKALAMAIEQNDIAGAALDVVEHEPLQTDSPLLPIIGHPNFILTPHIAWTSDQAMTFQAEQVVSNIEAFVAGKEKNRVV